MTMVDVTSAFDRALKAESRLCAIDRMVRAFCDLAPTRRSRKAMCGGCIWELILKPLVSPLVGWGRGYPAKQAKAPDPNAPPWEIVSLADLPEPEPATSETEKWLRTSAAYDAVTDVWLKQLDNADPGNDHGIGCRNG